MLRYLKQAFFATFRMEGLGDVPLNLLGLATFGILGFAHPGFWFLGGTLEAAYLLLATQSPRFRRQVDAGELRDRFDLLIFVDGAFPAAGPGGPGGPGQPSPESVPIVEIVPLPASGDVPTPDRSAVAVIVS